MVWSFILLFCCIFYIDNNKSSPKSFGKSRVVTLHGRKWTRLLRVLAAQSPLQTSPITQPRVRYIHNAVPVPHTALIPVKFCSTIKTEHGSTYCELCTGRGGSKCAMWNCCVSLARFGDEWPTMQKWLCEMSVLKQVDASAEPDDVTVAVSAIIERCLAKDDAAAAAASASQVNNSRRLVGPGKYLKDG